MLSQELIIHMIQKKHELAIRQCTTQVDIIITYFLTIREYNQNLIRPKCYSFVKNVQDNIYTTIHTVHVSKIHELPTLISQIVSYILGL